MVAVCHLEFSKLAILVTRPVSEPDSALRTKFRVNATRSRGDRPEPKNDFQYGGRLPF